MADISGAMPKGKDTKRNEVHLLPEIIDKLQYLANKANRSLKNYMETVLIDHADFNVPDKIKAKKNGK